MLFSRMEMNERLKQKIRQQAVGDHAKSRRLQRPKTWVMGAAAATVAAAVWLVAGVPFLQQPSIPSPTEQPAHGAPPVNGGASGSELSALVTTPVSTLEEAIAAFGGSLLVPTVLPEGFALKEIVVVGEQGQPARDAIFTYLAGEKSMTYVVSRNPAAFPMELFTKTQVSEVEGYMFEQEGLTELFWMKEGMQYSITGQITGVESMKIAESLE
ncbi:DUF4367 domain-containing protein [Paenibacillus nanensis]|nr:DUF4367 domain-containing protein [Paenibacillus nanensis]